MGAPLPNEDLELEGIELLPKAIRVLKKNILWYHWNDSWASWKERYVSRSVDNVMTFYKDKARQNPTEEFTIDGKTGVSEERESSTDHQCLRVQKLQRKRCCLLPNSRHCRLLKPYLGNDLASSDSAASVVNDDSLDRGVLHRLDRLRQLVDPKGSSKPKFTALSEI